MPRATEFGWERGTEPKSSYAAEMVCAQKYTFRRNKSIISQTIPFIRIPQSIHYIIYINKFFINFYLYILHTLNHMNISLFKCFMLLALNFKCSFFYINIIIFTYQSYFFIQIMRIDYDTNFLLFKLLVIWIEKRLEFGMKSYL